MKMKVLKQIITKEQIDLDILDITLLSKEEYETYHDFISPVNSWWWLRSSGTDQRFVAEVRSTGLIRYDLVDRDCVAIRPVLIYNPKSSDLVSGDTIDLAGHMWTILKDGLMLCDEAVDYTVFRKERMAANANDYEASDAKKWLENWAQEKGIIS